ncbi:MAG: Gfo/Idh/MocA family oxidoreductase [Chloroflexi bacterium]|nr:Gfo/Idh/MocA family oxidoreductase [Chloroflexota bacterium]
MQPVRVGVIGTGTMGQRHCRVYSGLRHVQLSGICDAAPDVGAQAAQQYDVPFYERAEDLLEHVDAVSLATPTPSHYDLAMCCLAQGVHVLIEKPITETVKQAEILTDTAEASHLVVQVGHIERFNPAYIELRNVLEDITPLAVNLRRLSPYAGSNTDVDVVLDLMIHDIDLALDMMGQAPTSVSTQGLTAFSGTVDHAIVNLAFDSGPLLTMTASRVTEQKVRSIEVTALEAYVESDLLNKSISVHRRTVGQYVSHNHRGVKYRQESIVERIHVPIFEPLLLELQHFIDCILQNKAPQVTVRDGLNALQLAVTIRDAILADASNRPNVHGFARRDAIGSALAQAPAV